jgi:hypothetical protein
MPPRRHLQDAPHWGECGLIGRRSRCALAREPSRNTLGTLGGDLGAGASVVLDGGDVFLYGCQCRRRGHTWPPPHRCGEEYILPQRCNALRTPLCSYVAGSRQLAARALRIEANQCTRFLPDSVPHCRRHAESPFGTKKHLVRVLRTERIHRHDRE